MFVVNTVYCVLCNSLRKIPCFCSYVYIQFGFNICFTDGGGVEIMEINTNINIINVFDGRSPAA